MLADIILPYPQWYVPLCFILGAVYATFLYWRDTRFKELKPWLPYVMSFARGTVVTGIAWLLLGPMLRSITEDTKKPIVVIAQDVSESVAPAIESQDTYKAALDQLREQLSAEYQVVDLAFGSDVQVGRPDTTTQQSTDISGLVHYVRDNYADQNLGAIIMASDGIYNEGRDPRYLVKDINAPFYTIAQGDTTKRKDLLLKNVYHNKIAYLGDKFVMQVDVQAFNGAGAGSVLTVSKVTADGQSQLGRQSVSIDSDAYFETIEFTLDADQTGIVRYRLAVSPIADEINTTNNYRDLYIEVLDSRQKILLLAHAPHPDLSALKAIITTNKNYQVDIGYAKDPIDDLKAYNLVVLHNLPSQTYSIASVQDQLTKAKIPALYIVGAQTSPAALNKRQAVIALKGTGSSTEDIQAVVRPAFSAYILDQAVLNKLTNYPPLTAPFGEYTSAGTTEVVFEQRIKKIETRYPLLAYATQGGVKTGVLVGEGLWRWRLFNYMKEANYDVVDEFVNKMVQYLVVKDDKRKFRAIASKNIFQENESILIDAQLYNDSYELINDPDVFAKIVDDSGKEYTYTMSRNNGYYSLDAGLFEPGNYRFTATSNNGGKQVEQGGRFSVEAVQLESYDLTARHDLMRQLAQETGGRMYFPDGVGELQMELLQTNKLKPVIYQSTDTQSVLNLKWIFALLMSLLGLEWFLRRYYGYY